LAKAGSCCSPGKLAHAENFDKTSTSSSACAFFTPGAGKSCTYFDDRLKGIQKEAEN